MRKFSRTRFILGALKHPTQAWLRIRELLRMLVAPTVRKTVDIDQLPAVRLLPVTDDQALQARLAKIYARNPSPFVNGPTTIARLQQKIDSGIRFFLVVNDKGEDVGARAFDPHKKLLMNTVTRFRFRGNGYQAAAGIAIISLLASEGHREFRSAILRTNTRIQRSMVARGWTIEPDPDNRDLLRGVYRLD